MAFFPIPSMLLKQPYTFNSLKNTETGVKFSVKNRLTDVKFTELKGVSINGNKIPTEKITLKFDDGTEMRAADVSENNPIDFSLKKVMDVYCETENLQHGKHKIKIAVKGKGYGSLKFEVEDAIPETESYEVTIPRDRSDDYSEDIINNTSDSFLTNKAKRPLV